MRVNSNKSSQVLVFGKYIKKDVLEQDRKTLDLYMVLSVGFNLGDFVGQRVF